MEVQKISFTFACFFLIMSDAVKRFSCIDFVKLTSVQKYVRQYARTMYSLIKAFFSFTIIFLLLLQKYLSRINLALLIKVNINEDNSGGKMSQIVEGHNITVPRKSGGPGEALFTNFQKKWALGTHSSATPENTSCFA